MEKELEIWRPVAGYEGFYEVSNCGRVKSLEWIETLPHPRNAEYSLTRVHREKILRNRIDSKDKYYRVCLRKNGTSKDHLVHRIEMDAFVPNPLNLPCVNHKDKNTQNNFIFVNPDGTVDLEKSNLEWCTYQYNLTYLDAVDLRRKKISKRVVCLSKDGVFVSSFDSVKEAAKYIGMSACYIGECCRGRECYPGGYKWKYEE